MDVECDSDDSNPSPTGIRAFFADLSQKFKDEDATKQKLVAKRATNKLCHYCSRVGLKPGRLSRQVKSGYSDRTWYLGTFKDVLARENCPLCRLVVAAILGPQQNLGAHSYRDEIHGMKLAAEVEIRWSKGMGFAVVSPCSLPERWISFISDDYLIDITDDEEDDDDDLEDLSGEDEHEDEDEDEEDEEGFRTSTKLPIKRARVLKSGRSIDKHDVETWLFNCKNCHGETCKPIRDDVAGYFRESSRYFTSYAFRLIDVKANCIIDAPIKSDGTGYEYVALSYVWGGVGSLKLVLENKAELYQRGSLLSHIFELPWTIQDAILLTRKLNFRYLWVDALCLVQDDQFDMFQGVTEMDKIFAGATLTIIAASGSTANAGLPGVGRGTRRVQQTIEEVKGGIQMTVIESLDSTLEHAPYSSRAWTLQEVLLSQRTLIFTPDGGLYFRCLRGVWSLDTVDDEFPYASNYTPSQIYHALDEHMSSMASYNMLLLEYTNRQLSNPSDAMNAFYAFQNILSLKMRSDFHMGIPSAALDFYLLFDGNGVTLERRDEFPSWSWAGWKGRVALFAFASLMWPGDLEEWLRDRTWIVWFRREEERSSDKSAPVPVYDHNTDTADDPQNNNRERRKTFARYAQKHSMVIDTSQTNPIEVLPANIIRRSQDLLQFWTLAIYLSISLIEDFDGMREVRERGRIVDRNGEFCGSVRLGGYFITEKDIDKPLEFILLSECKDQMPGSELFEDERTSAIGTSWDMFWVMLIVGCEDGVTERRGLGQIYQKAVSSSLDPGPAWKEIFLA